MIRLQADWVTAPHSRAVMDALGGQGYFVGGCVRNALLDAPVADIDVATPLTPDEVLARLRESEIKAIPTGFDHGTVTAVYDGKPVEITTFRKDIDTDGRRATVAFTDDIAQDAARRDFTMNALYADPEGHLVDPLGGLPDLKARRVRFIGLAQDRIREDYLRILRFFRFHAWYGSDGLDADGLAACAELADGITQLARERVGWEMRKLLSSPDPAPSVAAMAATGVLAQCLSGAVATVLPVLVHLEDSTGAPPDWLRRLVSLGGQGVSEALRLSRAEDRELHRIISALDAGESDSTTAYRHGLDIARSAALIRAASTGSGVSEELDAALQKGASAQFPVSASDLISGGIAPGPELGKSLKSLEERWISSSFSLGRDELLAGVGGTAD